LGYRIWSSFKKMMTETPCLATNLGGQ